MNNLTDWFGLSKIPFGKDLNPQDFFDYPQLTELHQHLALTISSATGMLITGDAGTGKTTAVRGYVTQLPVNKYRTIYLGNDQEGGALFTRIGLELGVKVSMGRSQRMIQLNQHIRRNVAGSGKQLVLVIDEAHLMDGSSSPTRQLLDHKKVKKCQKAQKEPERGADFRSSFDPFEPAKQHGKTPAIYRGS